ncbi:2'-5' RNA ligase family protein [Klenkia sp. PcliD-1-E]|uniref:2'-5' RNA ligase family protein n=1 Tax=Klenkia sp. PcliD-1-E TaxID=2954492 RepID=UPI002098371C|nr:2'-5' RNA ligase family protein [Klenkia sp. PcliD-1-E]MCO7219358.1 2'-5' RNA ligase family protein [Klenkia sp. PcliD-1-E]
MTAPLVVTLLVAEEAQQRFDELRARHFPADRLVVGAHVTLFHAVPGEHEDAVRADLAAAADRPGFEVEVAGVRLLGRGVAYDLRSDDVVDLRTALARRWAPWLTRQDAQWRHPHVTVQNKVTPAAARALHGDLAAGFEPYPVPAAGLGLWRYEGGPWSPLARYVFG